MKQPMSGLTVATWPVRRTCAGKSLGSQMLWNVSGLHETYDESVQVPTQEQITYIHDGCILLECSPSLHLWFCWQAVGGMNSVPWQVLCGLNTQTSQPHTVQMWQVVLKHNKYIGILSIAVTTLLYIMTSTITISSMYIAHVHTGIGCNSYQGHVNDSGEFWRVLGCSISGVTGNTI